MADRDQVRPLLHFAADHIVFGCTAVDCPSTFSWIRSVDGALVFMQARTTEGDKGANAIVRLRMMSNAVTVIMMMMMMICNNLICT